MAQYLSEVNVVSTVLRLLLALFLGGVLGFAREKKGRPAGLRTYMVVCVSSALVMITNQYMAQEFKSVDVGRMGAQIISGIGFLGAGTIIITGRNKVKGLTTAAGLWAAACLGIAAGIGFYYGALIGGLMILIVMEFLYRIDLVVLKNTQFISVYVEFDKISSLSQFLSWLKEQDIHISDFEIKKGEEMDDHHIAATVSMRFLKKVDHAEMLHQFTGVEGIRYIEEI